MLVAQQAERQFLMQCYCVARKAFFLKEATREGAEEPAAGGAARWTACRIGIQRKKRRLQNILFMPEKIWAVPRRRKVPTTPKKA